MVKLAPPENPATAKATSTTGMESRAVMAKTHDTKESADNAGSDDGRDPNDHGNPRAIDQARKVIPPQLIRAEDIGRRAAFHPHGRDHASPKVNGEGVIGCQPRRKNRDKGDEADNAHPHYRARIAPDAPPIAGAGGL
jgi:hypothetical protein